MFKDWKEDRQPCMLLLGCSLSSMFPRNGAFHRFLPSQRRRGGAIARGDDTFLSSCRSFASMGELFNPTETHVQLRTMIRDFVRNEVSPFSRAKSIGSNKPVTNSQLLHRKRLSLKLMASTNTSS